MAVFPQEFFDHVRAAFREQLLAWRSLLDGWVEALEEREAQARSRRRRPAAGGEGAGPAPDENQ